MTTAELTHACHVDQQKKMRDSPHCFQLFIRALVDEDQAAWDAIVAEFSGVVRAWVYRHPSFGACNEPADAFVNEAFARLWRYGRKRAQENRFTRLSQCLKYVADCVNSAVTDHYTQLRRDQLWDSVDVTLVEPFVGRWEAVDEKLDMEIIINEVYKVATSQAEQIIVKEVWMSGVPPRQLCINYPQLFDSATAVSNIKRNLTKRLQRHFSKMAQKQAGEGLVEQES